MSGGVAMSASAKTIRSVRACEHPRPDRRALAAVRDRDDGQRRAGLRVAASPAARATRSGGAVGAAVVDDEDLDPAGQLRRAGRPVARGLAAPAEVAEQLVQGRLDPVGLVVGGQHDRQGRGRVHRGQSRPGIARSGGDDRTVGVIQLVQVVLPVGPEHEGLGAGSTRGKVVPRSGFSRSGKTLTRLSSSGSGRACPAPARRATAGTAAARHRASRRPTSRGRRRPRSRAAPPTPGRWRRSR